MIRIAALTVCLATPVQAADFEFCWIGANGFTVSGQMTVPDAALTKSQITETDVTAFRISGTRDGAPIGQWSLSQITPQTSWNLNFDPAAMAFLVGGYSDSDQGQQWNANGSVNDCGISGFGFNLGAGGQDVCVDNTYRRDSIRPADTPLLVYLSGHGPACLHAPLLGELTPHSHRHLTRAADR